MFERFALACDDIFWSAATSHLVLGIVAIVLIAAIAVGYTPFVQYLPAVGQYVKVARLVSFLSFGLLCALVDRRAADARAQLAQTRIDLSFAQKTIRDLAGTEADAAQEAAAAKKAVAAITQKVTTYGIDYPPTIPTAAPAGSAAVVCNPRRITVDQSRRLREIANGGAVTERRKRSLISIVRGIGANR